MSETRKAQIIIEFDLTRDKLSNGEAVLMMAEMLDKGTVSVSDLRDLKKVANLTVGVWLGE